MRARRFYPELQREADLRKTKDGESTTNEEGEHPSNLAEAYMEGEHGPKYYGNGRGGGNSTSDLPYGGVYGNNDSTTRIPMYRTESSFNKNGPFADPTASTYTIPYETTTPTSTTGGGNDQRWREVEERERREAELANVYDTDLGSYSHLPLASASEVEAQSGGYAGVGTASSIPYQPPQPRRNQPQSTPNRGYGSVDLSR